MLAFAWRGMHDGSSGCHLGVLGGSVPLRVRLHDGRARLHLKVRRHCVAIRDVKLGDGRATLTLKDGAQVPVSRTYAKAPREAGWY